MFVLENVWKKYGATIALKGVSASFGRGLSVVIGPNGSGKSTMLKIMIGLVKPSRGKVLSLETDPWRNRDKILTRIGIGLEGMNMPWWMTGMDMLKLYSSQHDIRWEDILNYAELLGVTEYWNRLIRGYSMGMRKKLLLAAAFSGAREALILDEPFTLLDTASVQVVDDLITKFSREIPVIVATHVVTESIMKANTVTVLHEGKIIAKASLEGDAFQDYICTVSDLEKAIKSLKRLGDLESLSYRGNRLSISFKEKVKLGNLEGVIECTPTLMRWLHYSELLYEGGVGNEK